MPSITEVAEEVAVAEAEAEVVGGLQRQMHESLTCLQTNDGYGRKCLFNSLRFNSGEQSMFFWSAVCLTRSSDHKR